MSNGRLPGCSLLQLSSSSGSLYLSFEAHKIPTSYSTVDVEDVQSDVSISGWVSITSLNTSLTLPATMKLNFYASVAALFPFTSFTGWQWWCFIATDLGLSFRIWWSSVVFFNALHRQSLSTMCVNLEDQTGLLFVFPHFIITKSLVQCTRPYIWRCYFSIPGPISSLW